MSNPNPAATPQPQPTGEGPRVLDLVLADLTARAEVGREKYGTYLRAGNGRDALMDAYQEALDLCMYLGQALMERDGATEPPTGRKGHAPDYSALTVTLMLSTEDGGWIAETDKTGDLSAFGDTIEEAIRGMADVWALADEHDPHAFRPEAPALPLAGVVFDGGFYPHPCGSLECKAATPSGKTAMISVFYNQKTGHSRWLIYSDCEDDSALLDSGHGGIVALTAAARDLGATVRGGE